MPDTVTGVFYELPKIMKAYNLGSHHHLGDCHNLHFPQDESATRENQSSQIRAVTISDFHWIIFVAEIIHNNNIVVTSTENLTKTNGATSQSYLCLCLLGDLEQSLNLGKKIFHSETEKAFFCFDVSVAATSQKCVF